MSEFFLDRVENITLRELLDVPALQELADHILEVHQMGMYLVSLDQVPLIDTCSIFPPFKKVLQQKAKAKKWDKVSKRIIDDLPKRGAVKEFVFDQDIHFTIVPIINELDVIGAAALGPYVLKGASNESDIPHFEANILNKIFEFISSILDVLVFSSYKRHLTNMTHIEAISDSYQQLEKANKDLTESYNQLKELDQMKSNFLAVVSHELRTPLTSVIGYSEMLYEGIAGDLNDGQKKYVQVIMNKGDQLLGMIREILNLSKIEAGKMKISPAPMKPREIISHAVETIKPVAAKKDLNLVVEIDANTPETVPLDRDKLLQIFNNLLSNAVKFTDDGGKISLFLKLFSFKDFKKENMPVPEHKVDQYLLFQVVDTGIGISDEDRKKIFNKFFQVDGSSTREYGGTGLGLAITKSFVELHGGNIWVESIPNEGTHFFFTIPVT